MNAPNIKRVGVIGLGLLGRGIAACFLAHGFEVIGFERDQTIQASARAHISEMIDELVEFGGFNGSLRESWAARYSFTNDFAVLRDCSFIVESVTEDAATKLAVFDGVEAHVSPATIIASNSSAIPITKLQQGRQHPERFLAMHWAEPAHATRFMELIPGEKTSDATLKATLALAKSLGKDPVVLTKDIPGFIVNRIGYAMYREALSLMDSGIADAETIDRSMRNALGLWATLCGPFRWIDLTGGPELYAKALQNVLPTLNNATEIPRPLRELADAGARGVVNGRGFYNYTPEEAQRWSDLYRKHAWRVTQMQNEYFPINKESHS